LRVLEVGAFEVKGIAKPLTLYEAIHEGHAELPRCGGHRRMDAILIAGIWA